MSKHTLELLSKAGGLSALTVLLMVLGPIGCGAGPKGPNLLDLESMRDSNYARTVRINPEEVEQPRVRESRERAYQTVSQSDTYYESSIDAWEASEKDRSEELANQGLLLYRAAEAYSHAADARLIMEQANASFQAQLERRNRYNDMVAANEEVIELLTALQRLYEQTEVCRSQMLGASAAQDSRNRSTYAIQMARSAQREAENLHANQFAQSVFNEGLNSLTQAISLDDRSSFDQAYELANSATSRFRDAVTQSQTEFNALQARLLESSRNQGLRDAAMQMFRDNAYVDARGLVIVLPDMFPSGRSEVRDDKTHLVDQIVNLAADNRRYEIQIEGHTSDQGSRESNQTIGQARAEAIQDYLVQNDIRASRLTVVSFGEDYPRYDNMDPTGQANNNRVEVVFKFED